jgi:phosphoribosylformimino-5-aminoimidazole carboxamide ribotide isomerase
VILYPAIDIRGGKAVRLLQGDYAQETVYDADPLDAAIRWVDDGARALHVVDLDGAREGRPVNADHLRRIAADVDVPVQCGGGVRDAAAARTVIDAGADRVVLGTAALRDPKLVGALVDELGERVVVSVDTRGGRAAVSGWTEETDLPASELVALMADRGIRRFVHTPVEVDGTLDGPAMEGIAEVAGAAGEAELIYSGGVGQLEHLRELAGLGIGNLGGVIVGRALYEQRFTVAEGQAALDSPSEI